MNYFKILGVVFGLAAFLKPFYMHLIPWDENKFLAKAYTKERQVWIIPTAILGILLVIFTWYKEFTTDIKYSLILTIIFSLTLIKIFFFLFDYEKFQKWVSDELSQNNGKEIVLIDIFVGIFGLAILIFSLIAY